MTTLHNSSIIKRNQYNLEKEKHKSMYSCKRQDEKIDEII